jgi:hypothetical protein
MITTRKSFRFLISLLFSVFLLPCAQAANFVLMGGSNWTHLNDSNIPGGSPNNSTGAQLGWEAGAGLNFHLVPQLVTFEVDGIYDHSKQSYGSGYLSENTIQVPAIFHLWLGHALSIGAGGFYEFGTGNAIYTDGSGNQISSGALSNYGLNSSNYGALADVRIRIPVEMGHFFIDGRYLYGLKALNSSGSDSLQSREVQTMIGYSFMFGGGGYR